MLHIYVFNLYKGLTVYARVDGTCEQRYKTNITIFSNPITIYQNM
jgi:hypothetical protein